MEEKTILVIEDNESNLKLVRALLRMGNYKIHEAMDAETGILLSKEVNPDIILMDLQLPGMDGLTATRILKEDPASKKIPIIALTSFAMEGDEKKSLDAGCDGYITKPIDTRSFLNTIHLFLDNGEKVHRTILHQTSFRSKILIVDDDPINVKLLAAKLSYDIYEITKAYSGQEALNAVAHEMPDLILLDIMMPGINGFEVTRILKGDTKTRHIPIILITALDGSENTVKGIEAGAEEFLNKPVNTTELHARVTSMLRLKQYQEQLTIRTQSEELFADSHCQKASLHKGEEKVPCVLLVEDDERDTKLIKSYLQDEPLDLICVKSGEETLSLVRQKKIDLVLLDILLPDMDGFNVCRSLKRMVDTKDIQIVFITSLQDIETKITGVELGADDFLIKPVNCRELKARINVLLKKKKYFNTLHSHYETALNSAISDGLTGLYNHLYFKRYLELEIKRSARQKYPVTLIMADIDNFKQLNDIHGHLAGDHVLRELSHLIKKEIRETDLAARYGGEEFSIVLPYSDMDGAFAVAERIRQRICSHTFLKDLSKCVDGLTLSMGLAYYPSNASSLEELIQKADLMLYKAKRQGKNRICSYENGGPG